MAFVTHRAHQKRKGPGRTIFAHISRHNSTETAHRRGRGQRPEQVRQIGPICDQEQVGARLSVLIAPSNHQIRDHKAVKSWTCKSLNTCQPKALMRHSQALMEQMIPATY